MLRISFEVVDERDMVTPINVAAALIDTCDFDVDEFQELADHIHNYVMRKRNQRWAADRADEGCKEAKRCSDC